MDGIKLLTDLFTNVPDVDADVGRAGEGRIAEFSTGIKSMAAAAGLPPGHLEIVSVGFSDKPALTPLPASEVDAEADIRRIEGQIRTIMGVDPSDTRPIISEPARWVRKACALPDLYEVAFGKSSGDGYFTYATECVPSLVEQDLALTTAEFDAFFEDPLADHLGWFENHRGGSNPHAQLVTRVTAPDRPTLLINPEGHNYARYMGVLVADEAKWKALLPPSQQQPTPVRSEREALVEEIANTLGSFTGSCEFTKWSILFRKDVLTEGTKYLADKAGCYWLMDLIASVQNLPRLKRNEFQVWYVIVCHAEFTQPKPWQWGPDGTELEECSGRWAWVWCEDGREKENSVCYTQLVPFTDFPLANIETQRQPPARDPDRERGAFKLYANRNELGGITILLPSEY